MHKINVCSNTSGTFGAFVKQDVINHNQIAAQTSMLKGKANVVMLRKIVTTPVITNKFVTHKVIGTAPFGAFGVHEFIDHDKISTQTAVIGNESFQI